MRFAPCHCPLFLGRMLHRIPILASSRTQAGGSRGGLPFGAAFTAQDDACRWIYQMGACARSADDGLISMGIHGHIVCGKALNTKARVRAAVEEKRHNSKNLSRSGCWH